MNRPIAVFDAGIGSYAIARKIADRFPGQDVLYFADRASFPYGGKGRSELLGVMRSTIERLESYGPAAIVIASNAPSVMVLDEIKSWSRTPIIGVFPPVRRALETSASKRIAIMGVASLISSSEIRTYVARESAGQGGVDLVSASDLAELVENGAFLTDADRTLTAVRAKLDTLAVDTDVVTLSSTHLPWLLRYFEQAGPRLRFLDPADDVVEAVASYATRGCGAFRTLVSEREGYDLADFQRMLARLGLDLTIERV
ncbi:Asp/Glu racemase [Bradyrhizobium rifense]|uniref:Asp/Glu racemase n=1 Tax=Bradyrhizobium rifense TaxID=515499 RepID=A0A5D3KXU5_9BRAD|nr:Asp/Glu racemase [Bradyrhizobium rifense]